MSPHFNAQQREPNQRAPSPGGGGCQCPMPELGQASYNSGRTCQNTEMNPLVNAFFVGRALAQALNEQLEKTVTNALSELGKFDAEQRERLREFTQEVLSRAAIDAENAESKSPSGSSSPMGAEGETVQLQETIDELRAEIAQVRAQLQRYRSRSL